MAYVFKRGEQFPVWFINTLRLTLSRPSTRRVSRVVTRPNAGVCIHIDHPFNFRRKERVQFDKVRVVVRVKPRTSLMPLFRSRLG